MPIKRTGAGFGRITSASKRIFKGMKESITPITEKMIANTLAFFSFKNTPIKIIKTLKMPKTKGLKKFTLCIFLIYFIIFNS